MSFRFVAFTFLISLMSEYTHTGDWKRVWSKPTNILCGASRSCNIVDVDCTHKVIGRDLSGIQHLCILCALCVEVLHSGI